MITKRALSMVNTRTSMVLLSAALAGCANEAPCVGEACSGLDPVVETPAPAPEPPSTGTLSADFRAHLQPGAKSITFERIDARSGASVTQVAPGTRPQDLTDLTVTQDTVPGSGPANSVELVTNSVGYNGQCPAGFQTNSFCGNVTLRHFYGLALSDVHVQVTKVTDAGGATLGAHGGINNDASIHGLDASQGLWKYTSAAATSSGGVGRSPDNQATRDWVFANPDDADTWVYLRVVASLYPTEWFNPGYTTTQSAPLQAGQPAIIHYDYSRNTTCRGTNWRMVASFFGPNTNSHSLTFPGHAGDTSLDVVFAAPFGNPAKFYFRNLDDTGCSNYDSNGGVNWSGSSQNTTPVLHFKPDYSQYAEGTLKVGTTLTVDYDLTRLHNCIGVDSYDRLPSSQTATMYYNFPSLGASFTGVSLTGLPYGVPGTINGQSGQLQVAPTIPLPSGANEIDIYFQGGPTACYDSNNSANYKFAISP